jgi:hypothetical protein
MCTSEILQLIRAQLPGMVAITAVGGLAGHLVGSLLLTVYRGSHLCVVLALDVSQYACKSVLLHPQFRKILIVNCGVA